MASKQDLYQSVNLLRRISSSDCSSHDLPRSVKCVFLVTPLGFALKNYKSTIFFHEPSYEECHTDRGLPESKREMSPKMYEV